jgi:hypothetical protein
VRTITRRIKWKHVVIALVAGFVVWTLLSLAFGLATGTSDTGIIHKP